MFTNHTGEKTVFYSWYRGNLFFASRVQDIMAAFKSCQIPFHLSMAGAYSIVTYAYMYDDLTICEEIRRLRPGEYLRICGGKHEIKTYYKVQNQNQIHISEAEAIEEIDRLFSRAVAAQLEKNREYHYRDYIPLSAGLDSRMTTFCARKISQEPIYSFTYSETGQWDYKIPLRISRSLKTHWLFKNLDHGLALYDIEHATQLGDGLLYYVWPAQLDDFMKILDKESLGIVHTGVIGDVVIGTFFNNRDKMEYALGDGAYSTMLLHKLREVIEVVDYDNYEIGMYYNRAFNGACLGYALAFQKYTEAISPFMDVEFLDFCMSLPVLLRMKHYIYYKWVNQCYPKAALYSHNGIKIPSYKYPDLKLKGRRINIEKIPSLCLDIIQSKFNTRYNMNPFAYWYDHNHELRAYLDGYFIQKVDVLDPYQELKQDIVQLYQKGNVMEKLLAISLIAIVDQIF